MESRYFKDKDITDFMRDLEAVPYVSKIEFTNLCNLNCPACPTGILTEQHREDIPLALLQKIVDNNWLRNTPYVELMMSGEATLHRHFEQAVNIVKSSGVMVGLSTNLVDAKKIPILARLDSVTVSMDVFNKEGYEKSRPPMKFDRLISNIRTLVDMAMPSTMIYLQLLRTEFTEPYFIESISKAKQFVEELNNRSVKSGGKANVVLRYVSDCFGGTMGRQTVQFNKRQCLTPSTAVVIKSSGTVHPCGYCFTGKEEGLVLGSIYTHTLEEIWDGEPVRKLRKAHQEQKNLPARCMVCQDINRNNHVFQSSISTDIIRHRSGILIK